MIEELVNKALLGSATLQENLARYGVDPAIFYERAAHDQDPDWDAVQYPRCVYAVEWMYDAERTKAGVVTVDILNLADAGTPIEIADGLVNEISGMFMTQEDQTYSIIWSRSDPFETEGEEPKKMGISVYFDIVAYPIQMTTTPDPVLSTMNWIKEHQAEIMVIGHDRLDELWFPTDENPACYVRIGGETSQVRPSYSVVWLRANMVVHIICPSAKARVMWLKRLAEDLAIEEEIITDDESPMFIKALTINHGSNPINAGQLTFDGEYGVLRKHPEGTKIANIQFGTAGRFCFRIVG